MELLLWILGFLLVAAFIGAIVNGWKEGGEQALAAQDSGIPAHLIFKHGALNPQMVCPHCQTQGKVLSKAITKKAGISGGKATGAILTGGVSMLATGLSRKEAATEAHCANCSSTWYF